MDTSSASYPQGTRVKGLNPAVAKLFFDGSASQLKVDGSARQLINEKNSSLVFPVGINGLLPFRIHEIVT